MVSYFQRGLFFSLAFMAIFLHAAEPASKTAYVFIDNSYLFIEGQKMMAEKLELRSTVDKRTRINMAALFSFIHKDYDAINARAYGSEKSSLHPIWEAMEKAQIKPITFRRPENKPEKCVKTQMTVDLTMLALDAADSGTATAESTVIVITGSEDLCVGFKMILENSPYNLEVWSYSGSVSSKFSELEEQYPDRIQLNLLNAISSTIFYLALKWNPEKTTTPVSSSFILTFRPTDIPTAKREERATVSLGGNHFSALSKGVQAEATKKNQHSFFLSKHEKEQILSECAAIMTRVTRIPTMAYWADSESNQLICVLMQDDSWEATELTSIIGGNVKSLHDRIEMEVRKKHPQLQLLTETLSSFKYRHPSLVENRRDAGRASINTGKTSTGDLSSGATASASSEASEEGWQMVFTQDRGKKPPKYSDLCKFGAKCKQGKACKYRHEDHFRHAQRT